MIFQWIDVDQFFIVARLLQQAFFSFATDDQAPKQITIFIHQTVLAQQQICLKRFFTDLCRSIAFRFLRQLEFVGK
jgi:hypothetical protein